MASFKQGTLKKAEPFPRRTKLEFWNIGLSKHTPTGWKEKSTPSSITSLDWESERATPRTEKLMCNWTASHREWTLRNQLHPGGRSGVWRCSNSPVMKRSKGITGATWGVAWVTRRLIRSCLKFFSVSNALATRPPIEWPIIATLVGANSWPYLKKKGKRGRKGKKNHHDGILSIIGKLLRTSACMWAI